MDRKIQDGYFPPQNGDRKIQKWIVRFKNGSYDSKMDRKIGPAGQERPIKEGS